MTQTQTTMAAATPASAKRKRTSSREGQPQKAGWFARIVVFILCFLWIVPVIWLFLTSFRPRDDANDSGWWTLFWTPSAWGRMSFDNYVTAIDQGGLGEAFVNSLAVSVPDRSVRATAPLSFDHLRQPADPRSIRPRG